MEDFHGSTTTAQVHQTQTYTSTHIKTDVQVDIPAESLPQSQPRRIFKVPQHLHGDLNREEYDPAVLSLGPYHHGKPQFSRMEVYKEHVLNLFVRNSQRSRDDFYKPMLKSIADTRANYEEVVYGDEKLAEIILRDACFVIHFMEGVLGINSGMLVTTLGMSTVTFINCDFFMLENQIPLWVIKKLLSLRGGEDADALVYKYLCNLSYDIDDDTHGKKLPWKDEGYEPLHLLEAARITLIKQKVTQKFTDETRPHFLAKMLKWKNNLKTTTTTNDGSSSSSSKSKSKSHNKNNNPQDLLKFLNLPFRSVTYLKSKGVFFGPSSKCFKDIKFTSYHFFGKLQLPIWFINYFTKVFFSNIIAYEMSQGNPTDFTVTSYVNVMKSLIESSKDVKELREKGILYSNLGNDDVVKMFEKIDTYGLNNYGIFNDVREKLDRHCDSKAKTWMAELIHNYFSSPWTTIAFFAAMFLLCLAFLQTYYTIHTRN